jgi:hypothetical protein
MSTPAFLGGGDNHEVWMMETEATQFIGPSRSRLAADILWLGFTAFVFAVILAIVCWPLSAALSVHSPPDAAANRPAASLTSGMSAGSATAAPLPALAGGDRITRPGALPTPADVVGEGSSNVAPPSPIATPGKLAGASLTPPDRSPQAAQAAPATAAVSSPGTHRIPRHKPRPRPVAPKAPPQLTPW